MIKSISFSSLILFVAAVIEATVLANISFLPAVPDLVLLCVLYFSLQNGRLAGECTGFLGGLFLDFLSGCPLGLNCLIRTILGYTGGLLTKTLNTDGFFVSALIGFIATVLKGLLLLAVGSLFHNSVSSFKIISWAFLFELVINTILTPLIFKFLGIFNKIIIVAPEKL